MKTRKRGALDSITVAAQELGRRGGKARAKALSPDRRHEIAKKAIMARWSKAKAKSGK